MLDNKTGFLHIPYIPFSGLPISPCWDPALDILDMQLNLHWLPRCHTKEPLTASLLPASFESGTCRARNRETHEEGGD